jgi:hypothetical protein
MAQIIRAFGGLTRSDLVDLCRILEESFSPALQEARVIGKFGRHKLRLLFGKGKLSDVVINFGRVMGGKIYCRAQAKLRFPTAPFRLDASDFKTIKALKKGASGLELANRIVNFLEAKHDKNLEPLKQALVSQDILDHPYLANFNGIGSDGEILEAILFSRVQFTGIRAVADYSGTIYFLVQILAKLNELL